MKKEFLFIFVLFQCSELLRFIVLVINGPSPNHIEHLNQNPI